MNVKRILLTSDDGYRAIGSRILIAQLRDQYELTLVATHSQQSNIGGALDQKKTKEWGESMIDGVKTFWVKGSPSDAMDFASSYFNEGFDLILSGINWGPNVGYALLSSGTFAAGVRGVAVGLAPQAIALSWNLPAASWFKKHDEKEDSSTFERYPGAVAKKVIDLCLENDLWGKRLVNVNFPREETEQVQMTKLARDVARFYRYPVLIDHGSKKFTYPDEAFASEEDQEDDESLDTGALNAGLISVTPVAFGE